MQPYDRNHEVCRVRRMRLARLRVRSFPGVGWPEALTADLNAIEPSAEYVYPPLTEAA